MSILRVFVSLALMAMPALHSATASPIITEPPRHPVPASTILAGFHRLGVVGSVLYVAAHPDDENTRLLTWLANQRHLDTAYVSLTRGEGGQNLIGSELGPPLGRIRTFELLAARHIDGAKQYFTRALDFGYSKSAAETLAKWERDVILADLVRVVRTHRPDIIITRFSTSPPNHGHHTASAILAAEAFRLAADPTHIDGLPPHQTAYLFENKSHWRFKDGEDLRRYLAVDVNTYDALTGQSPAEVAARSRSQHKSQGFGTAPAFGKTLEYFEYLESGVASAPTPKSVFDNIDFGWSRFPGTSPIVAAHRRLLAAFDPRMPSKSAPALIAFIRALEALRPTIPVAVHHRNLKVADAASLLAQLGGIVAEARVATPIGTPGQTIEVEFEVVQRAASVSSEIVAVANPDGQSISVGQALTPGEPWRLKHRLTVPSEHNVLDTAAPDLRANPGLAISPDPRFLLNTTARMRIAGFEILLALPVTHAVIDPVHGERRTPLEIAPPVAVNPQLARDTVVPLVNARPADLSYRVTAFGAPRRGVLRLRSTPPATITPSQLPFALDAGEAIDLHFALKAGPASVDSSGVVSAEVVLDGETNPTPAVRRDVIQYDHLPHLSLYAPATVAWSAFSIDLGFTRKVAYIPGADDDVMIALQRAGYDVSVFDPLASFPASDDPLDRFDAVVVGIRALNIRPELELQHARLMRFVERGGRLLWQYNVSSRFRPLGPVKFGPGRLDIGADRITDENATMVPVTGGDGPPHEVFTRPNVIGPRDAEGWVQERGLYFASSWEPPWQPLLRMSDPGEAPLDGALMWAPHGRGAIIYTGLAFFRQLPAGVPGAFRLFANLLARSEARR